MKKPLLLLFSLLGMAFSAYATHIRGGEITASRRPNSTSTFDFVLTVYTDTSSPVDDTTLRLFFGDGDGSFQESPRYVPAILLVGKGTHINIYHYSHTYAAPGQYTVYHYKEFRNERIRNIGPTPTATYFYVETQITISPSIDQGQTNNSPVLNSFAVDIAPLGQVYVNNPAAFDPDGDSLSFELIPSRNFLPGSAASGAGVPIPIPPYEFPNISAGGLDSARNGPATMTIDVHKGLTRWDVPNLEGGYNVAIAIYEWRYGRRIGYVIRDLQIIVQDVRNHRPFITIPQDTCVLANDSLKKGIVGHDPDATDKLAITAAGGLFNISPVANRASISYHPPVLDDPAAIILQGNPAHTLFQWRPGCAQVRIQPYDATFKVEDRTQGPQASLNALVDIKTWSIRVIGPPPQMVEATPGLGSIRLDWASYACGQDISYFNIYRRVDSSTYRPDTCTTGVPPPEGFTLIGHTDGIKYTFLDDNNGQGLKRTNRYCYRITAQFAGPNRGESKESAQVCAQLKLDIPLLTNVSVRRTSPTAGVDSIRWTKPRNIDLTRFPGPYRYDLKRRAAPGQDFVVVKSTSDLNDTSFVDTGLNTDQVIQTYRVVFFFQDISNRVYADSADDASSINLQAVGTTKSINLNWSADVPWNNASVYGHRVYKLLNGVFALIDTTPAGIMTYTDTGTTADPLRQNVRYRYYVETYGRYSLAGVPSPLINASFITSAKLKDSIPPCPPQTVQLSKESLECPTCEAINANTNRSNVLTWHSPKRDSCALDLAGFNVYYKPNRQSQYGLLVFTTDTFLVHNNNGSLAGCYKVFAVDSSGNQNDSALVQEICNDNCVSVTLPNLITINNDKHNDYWTPKCITSQFISEVDLKIYSRWGRLVYSSSNKDIRWPGQGESDESAEPGVYYYYLKVRTIQLDDSNPFQNFKGWIEVSRTKP